MSPALSSYAQTQTLECPNCHKVFRVDLELCCKTELFVPSYKGSLLSSALTTSRSPAVESEPREGVLRAYRFSLRGALLFLELGPRG